MSEQHQVHAGTKRGLLSKGCDRAAMVFIAGMAAAVAITAMGPEQAQAQVGQLKDFTIHQPYVSTRALGMGGAMTAVADDFSTLFYNPAGLARIEEPIINMGLGVAVDPKFVKLYEDIDKVGKSDNVNDMVKLLESNYGNHYSARLPTLNAIWVRPGWGFAFIPVDLSLEMEIRQLAAATLNVVATQDTTIAFGRGWDVNWAKDHRFSLGVTTKAVYRGFYDKAFLASDLAFDSKLMRPEDAAEGLTFDADLGMLWTPKISDSNWWSIAKPTVGVAVRNVVDYGFTSNLHLLDKNSGQPAKLGRRYDVGAMFELPSWWIFKSRLMTDLRDMGHENWSFRKGSHIGAEFLWKVRSWWQGGWRVGVNQGYFAAGFTGELGMFKLDLATTAEEVGTSDSPKANRRYVLKTSLEW